MSHLDSRVWPEGGSPCVVCLILGDFTDTRVGIYKDQEFLSLGLCGRLFIIGKNLNIINGLQNKLSEHFCMTNLELISHYLGISATQAGGSVNYVRKSSVSQLVQLCLSITR